VGDSPGDVPEEQEGEVFQWRERGAGWRDCESWICLEEGGRIGGIGMKLEVERLLRQVVSRGYE